MKAIIFIFCLVSLGAFSQHHSFQKKIGGTGEEVIYSMTTAHDSAIVVAGYSTSEGRAKEIFISKLSLNGDTVWAYVYGGEKTDIAYSINPTNDNGFLISGQTTSFNSKKTDVFIMKIDKDGNILWSRIYGGRLVDIGFDAKQTSDDGYIIVGESNSFEAKASDAFVIKLDSRGQIQWSNLYGGDTIDYASKVIETINGYLIGGETNSYDSTSWDVWMIQLDWDGNVAWSKTYGGGLEDNFDDLILDTDEKERYVFVGSTESFGHKNRDVLFTRIEGNGDPSLVRTYGGDQSDEAKTVIKIDDGYILSGFSNSFNEELTDEDVYLLKLNSKGHIKYSKSFGNREGDYSWGMTYLDNTIFLGGHTNSFGEFKSEKHMYLLGIPEKRTIQTCELSNVQSISIPHDLLWEQMHVRDVEAGKKVANFRSKAVDAIKRSLTNIQFEDICSNGTYTDQEFYNVFEKEESEEVVEENIFD